MRTFKWLALLGLAVEGCGSVIDDMSTQPPPSTAGDRVAPMLSTADRSSLSRVYADENAQIELASLARNRSQLGLTLDYANAIGQSHGRFRQDVQAMAQQRGTFLPEVMSTTGQSQWQALANYSGPDFDRYFIIYQIEIQQEGEQSLQMLASRGEDVYLRDWALQAHATWQREEAWARQIHQNLLEGTPTTVGSDVPFGPSSRMSAMDQGSVPSAMQQVPAPDEFTP